MALAVEREVKNNNFVLLDINYTLTSDGHFRYFCWNLLYFIHALHTSVVICCILDTHSIHLLLTDTFWAQQAPSG